MWSLDAGKPMRELLKENIKSLTLEELEERFREMDEPAYRAMQVFEWLYGPGAVAFDNMTNLPKSLRTRLDEIFEVSCVKIEDEQVSVDGTRKILFGLLDGETVESVLIPDGDRLTLCISSQAGCALGCRFCLTGKKGFRRNLESGEIVDQIVRTQKSCEDESRITNIVFMGMGEPLRNISQVTRALETISAECGLGYSPRRITVSTSGIADRIAAFASEGVGLAVSLNAADDETRSAIMPVNRKYPLKRLMKECREYTRRSRRKITFEYVMLKGVNDRSEDADRLCGLLAGMACKINLIPFNECADLEFSSPEPGVVEKFRKRLLKDKFDVFVRYSRGSDISAACGQLGGVRIDQAEG